MRICAWLLARKACVRNSVACEVKLRKEWPGGRKQPAMVIWFNWLFDKFTANGEWHEQTHAHAYSVCHFPNTSLYIGQCFCWSRMNMRTEFHRNSEKPSLRVEKVKAIYMCVQCT